MTMEVIGPSKGGGIATAYTAMAEALSEAGHDVTVLFTERYYIGEWGEWVAQYAGKGIALLHLWDDLRAAEANVEVGTGCTTRACARSYKVFPSSPFHLAPLPLLVYSRIKLWTLYRFIYG